jgi:hypothetical protein
MRPVRMDPSRHSSEQLGSNGARSVSRPLWGSRMRAEVQWATTRAQTSRAALAAPTTRAGSPEIRETSNGVATRPGKPDPRTIGPITTSGSNQIWHRRTDAAHKVDLLRVKEEPLVAPAEPSVQAGDDEQSGASGSIHSMPVLLGREARFVARADPGCQALRS